MAHPFFNVYSIIKDVPSFWIMQAFFMPFLVFSFYAQKHYAWVYTLSELQEYFTIVKLN